MDIQINHISSETLYAKGRREGLYFKPKVVVLNLCVATLLEVKLPFYWEDIACIS